MKMYLAVFLSIITASLVTIYFIPCSQDAPILQDVYWGPGEQPKKMDQTIRPFKIKFEKEVKHRNEITNLKSKIFFRERKKSFIYLFFIIREIFNIRIASNN